MFIFKSNQKRCNPYASYTDANGTRYTRMPAELYEEIADPVPPEDYSDETYYSTEQDDAPYVIYTKKSEEQIASLRWTKIKVIRDNLTFNGGCQLGDKWFHSDTHSKVQQLALVMAGANLPEGIQWKTMDGSFITMTPELATAIYQAQMTQEQAIFHTCEIKKLDDSPVNEGWPETYSAD